jgi:hypothetical protein
MIKGANLIHEFYTHETRNPVYILVDTSLKNDSSFQIKAYIGAPFGVKDKDKLKSHGTIFTPIPVRIVTYDEEKSASKKQKKNNYLFLNFNNMGFVSFLSSRSISRWKI